MSTCGKRHLSAGIALAVTAWLAGCAQAPRTQLPDVPMASAFKEARGPWIEAGGSTAAIAFDGWWQGYGDPELDALQRRLIENSPDLASALARYQQAKAATDSLRAAQSPTLNTSLNAQRDRQSERRPLRVLGPTSPDWYNSATLGLDLSYEVDLWGRVSRQVEAGVASSAPPRRISPPRGWRCRRSWPTRCCSCVDSIATTPCSPMPRRPTRAPSI